MPNPETAASKLYCYVDETGQDTLGEFFIASIVVTGANRDALIAKLETIERASGKGKVKWIKVRGTQRLAYMRAIVATQAFQGSLYFTSHRGQKAFIALTVLSTAKAILTAQPSHPPATVFVDGLPKSRIRWFGSELRRLSVRTNKVVGVRREETDALTRLADACCGFVRAALSGREPEMSRLFEQAKPQGILWRYEKRRTRRMGSLSSFEARTSTGSVWLPIQFQFTSNPWLPLPGGPPIPYVAPDPPIIYTKYLNHNAKTYFSTE